MPRKSFSSHPVRGAREKFGLTQKEAADLLGISPETLKKIEGGKFDPVRPKLKERIAGFTGLASLPSIETIYLEPGRWMVVDPTRRWATYFPGTLTETPQWFALPESDARRPTPQPP